MVDSTEDEEPHRYLRNHYVTLQCGCITPSGSAEYEPYLAHWNPSATLWVTAPASSSSLLGLRCLCVTPIGLTLPLHHPYWAYAAFASPLLGLRCSSCMDLTLCQCILGVRSEISLLICPSLHCKLTRKFSTNRTPAFRLSSSAATMCVSSNWPTSLPLILFSLNNQQS